MTTEPIKAVSIIKRQDFVDKLESYSEDLDSMIDSLEIQRLEILEFIRNAKEVKRVVEDLIKLEENRGA